MKPTMNFLIFVPLVSAALAKEAPNVILVMTDDQGYRDLSCHGNPSLTTPGSESPGAYFVTVERR